ncbi:MAG: polysaccharide deacetylase family protein [Spirulinaceae cyanobacterium SM2_1_0]|nr:polysaccharide deacetylase family protein [Spirulinaceae cyanobacterium SM2_1_0]
MPPQLTVFALLEQPAALCHQLVAAVTAATPEFAMTDWAEQPVKPLRTLTELWREAIAGYPPPSEWPQLHDRARLARVPIFMYHDILPEKEVFFDVTPEELRADFEYLREQGATPITLEQLVAHLQTGAPLPDKPVLLTFDDGYGGHYEHVYPLLKEFDYPAVFSIYVDKMSLTGGRSSVTWEQLRKMAADPLVTIASHSISHPDDLRTMSDEELQAEVVESKEILETELGIPIRYFTYPVGRNDARVQRWVTAAGYRAALAMDDNDEHFAGESPSLLALGRFGQSRLETITNDAWGGPPAPRLDGGFDFTSTIRKEEHEVDGTRIILITGGRPETIHADSRYQVPEIIEGTGATAAVDGAFFSLKYLDSNVLIGPALSEAGRNFVPGNTSENPLLQGRPLVLIASDRARFVPFDHTLHNTRDGIVTALPEATDAFVGAAFLVRQGLPQPPESFGDLFDFDAARHRAFWGINTAGQPVIGVSTNPVGSVKLGEVLFKLGFRDAVMLDSGASTSLAYEGESLVGYTPRPVPHVVALYPPDPRETAELVEYQESPARRGSQAGDF